MVAQSKQAIIDQLTENAKRMKIVSDAARRIKAAGGIIEPESTPRPISTTPPPPLSQG